MQVGTGNILITTFICSCCISCSGNSDIPTKGVKDQSEQKRREMDLETAKILDEVISDILRNPLLKSTRNFYGTAGSREVGLDRSSMLPWPKGYEPNIVGFKFKYIDHEIVDILKEKAILGISLIQLDFPPGKKRNQNETQAYNYPIVLSVFNIGGIANDGPQGGSCIVFYDLRKQDKHWVIEYSGQLDP